MELNELQAIWQQYDKNLTENQKINKEILKHLLISKPEKRINREKIKAGFMIILPFILILLVLIPNIQYFATMEFYAGVFMFGTVISFICYWAIRYYLLLGKIDFSHPLTFIKKNVKKLEMYEIKVKKLGFLLMPIGITGIFLMCNFQIFSKESVLPLSLIVLVMIISIYFTFKFSIFKKFKIINQEIKEIEKLENESKDN